MNNNQQNQAMGVLGGFNGFAIVANLADGTSVIVALGALNTKVGDAALDTTAQNLSDAINELLTTINNLPQKTFAHINGDNGHRVNASSADDSFSISGADGIETSCVNSQVIISGLNLSNKMGNVGNLFSYNNLVDAINDLNDRVTKLEQ